MAGSPKEDDRSKSRSANNLRGILRRYFQVLRYDHCADVVIALQIEAQLVQ